MAYAQVLELGWRPEIPDHLPEGYKSFVRQCWEEDRKKVSLPSMLPKHAMSPALQSETLMRLRSGLHKQGRK